MGMPYSYEEDVTLLLAILRSRAHLRVKPDEEINPINQYISKYPMLDVEQQYNTIVQKNGFVFPPRTVKGLNTRYHNLLHGFGVGSLTHSETEDPRRIDLLDKIVRDRERHNERNRRATREVKMERCEEEWTRVGEETPRNGSDVYSGNIAADQNDEDEANEPCSDKASASEGDVPSNAPSKLKDTESKPKVKKEDEEFCEAMVDGIGEQKSRCVRFLQRMIDRSEERRTRREERKLAMEEALLGAEEVQNTGDSRSDEDFRNRELRLKCMKTIVAKRKLELREKKLEMRHEKKMMRLMEKMLS